MNNADKRAFGERVQAMLEIYGKSATPAGLDVWWRALARFDLDAVSEAMSAYLSDPQAGRYPPTPAGVLAKLVLDDGRPDPDEAWSIAVASRDEAETVCWTAEIAAACGVAAPIMDLGDRVGARMAFLAAYGRLVDAARRAGRPVAWSLSVGHDRERRAAAAERAVRQGLMAPERVAHLLPQPEAQGPIADVARMLTGKVVAHPARADGEYRQRMAALRAAMLGGEDAAPAKDLGDGLSAGDREILADLEQRRA